MTEPLEEEVNRFLRSQVVVRFDYQVFELGYSALQNWSSVLNLTQELERVQICS
jgi:hypothetical protein